MWKTALIKIENSCEGCTIDIKYVPDADLQKPENEPYRISLRTNHTVYLALGVNTSVMESRALMVDYIANYIQ
jgi:hypothetical protein